MNDFSPEVRNTGIWATDARKIVTGRASEVYLERTGQLEPPDLSDVEPVQWGLRLQEPIARAAADRLRLNIKEADYAMTHPKHAWMKSHFDYITEDGQTLLEIKNYNAFKANKYGDDGSNVVPADDMAQCLHEATVHGVDNIILCVLFGGQELRTFPLSVEEMAKEVLIQTEAELWGRIQARNPPDASSSEIGRILHPNNTGAVKVADPELEQACRELASIKKVLSSYKESVETLQTKIQNYMRDDGTLVNQDGVVLATWKQAKDGKAFDAKLFQQSMPDIYQKFVVPKAGSRRFLVK